MSKEDERQLKVRNYDKTAFITAITNSDAEDTVLGIEQAMDKNSVMIEPIFDADQLVTTRLEAEENIWNQSCIKSANDEIEMVKMLKIEMRKVFMCRKDQSL